MDSLLVTFRQAELNEDGNAERGTIPSETRPLVTKEGV